MEKKNQLLNFFPLEDEVPFKEIYLSQSTVLNTIVWKRFCGLHYPDDLITSTLSHGSPPAIQKDLILSGSNPEIQLENLLLCFVHEVSSTLPTGILSYAECYLIHTQFTHRKIFFPCWISSSHCLTGDMNLHQLLGNWHYSALFIPSHNTSALIALTSNFAMKNNLTCCEDSSLVSALTFSFIHYEKGEHTSIIQH